MADTQQSIAEWARETFGDAPSLFRLATRVNEEMAELLRHVASDQEPAAVLEEAADTLIVLYRFADTAGFDLRQAVRGNMHWGDVYTKATLIEITTRANEIMAKLLTCVPYGQQETIRQHAAHVGVLLYCLAAVLGLSLDVAVNQKMEVNRGRTWSTDGTGHGYHERVGRST